MKSDAFNRYVAAKSSKEAMMAVVRGPHKNVMGTPVDLLLPLNLLAGSSLELYLTAWLLACGVDRTEVVDHGHNIGELYKKAVALSLDVQKLSEFAAAVCGKYDDYTLRYLKNEDEITHFGWVAAYGVLDALDATVHQKVAVA